MMGMSVTFGQRALELGVRDPSTSAGSVSDRAPGADVSLPWSGTVSVNLLVATRPYLLIRVEVKRGPMNSALCWVALALVTPALTSCNAGLPVCPRAQEEAYHPPATEYLLVEYREGGEEAKPPKVEVRGTPTHKSRHHEVKAVAIRLPDDCLNESASRVSGVSGNAETILKTKCGPWLTEIEKALSAAHLQVFSWDALWKLEKEKGVSTYNAGKQLGAEIVLVFNSLEAGDIRAGASSDERFSYFSSNAAGDRLEKKPLDEKTRTGLKGFIGKKLPKSDAQQVVALSSILDATAVWTDTGESTWFYRRVVTFPVKRASGMKFLFGRLERRPWQPVSPLKEPSAVVDEPVGTELSAEDRSSTSVDASADAYREERLQLIRAGAQEMVAAYQSEVP